MHRTNAFFFKRAVVRGWLVDHTTSNKKTSIMSDIDRTVPLTSDPIQRLVIYDRVKKKKKSITTNSHKRRGALATLIKSRNC
mgnify:CR=1 FL=1